MQILLSCAKTMAVRIPKETPYTTLPHYRDDAARLAAELATLSTDDLGRLLHVSDRLAAENRRRYASFHNDGEQPLPALLAYTGVVFKHIAPADFTTADFEYAQHHLLITSFLYGLLRPLDAIRPYRLEGDAILPGHGEQNLFDYWRQRLTDRFIATILHDDGILINLASSEMKRLFDWSRICREVRVITPEFRIRTDTGFRTVVIYTKMCRGEMTRLLLKERLTDPRHLREFNWEGFRFDEAHSCDGILKFTM